MDNLYIYTTVTHKAPLYAHVTGRHSIAALQVLADPTAREKGFEPSIFINPQTLHLTLLMLKLYSDEDRHKAVQTLQGMQQQVGQLGWCPYDGHSTLRPTAVSSLSAAAVSCDQPLILLQT